MKAVLPAILYALFVWWFSTGLVLLFVLRRRAIRASLVGAALLFPIALYVLARTSGATDVFGAYAAFTAAIVLWGTQEVAFLTGFLTGPQPRPCPPGTTGLARVRCAVEAILYHEVALVVSGFAILIATWGQPNQAGSLTFLVLWVMRVSAKLNLFLGVPVLNDEALPAQIAFVRSYFLKAPVNGFFPVAVLLATLAVGGFVLAASDPATTTTGQTRYLLLATLTGLAVLEHLFMIVPVPIEWLWRWGTGGAAQRVGGPAVEHIEPNVERAVPSRP